MKIPEHKKFFAANGMKAENIIELTNIIATMSIEEFSKHTSNGNDFSNWVRDVLHKDELAEKIERTTSQEETIDVLTDEIIIDRKIEEIENTNNGLKLNKDFFKSKQFIIGLITGLLIGLIIWVMITWTL